MGSGAVTETLGGCGQNLSAVKNLSSRVSGKLQLAKCRSKVLRQLMMQRFNIIVPELSNTGGLH